MNKTININLGGLFFHIDEEAFKKLRHYLDSISRSLSDDPQGKSEIINDIELRISEILAEKIKDPRQVVSIDDIDQIIEVMGSPEEYETENSFESYSDTPNYKRRSRKLYRDGGDKFLGGVCSGLGHYMGIEPVWVRILFLILFFGFGTGLFLYIILWILLPEATTTAEKLEMEGEPVNIDNIEKRVRQEYDNIEQKVKEGDYVNKAKQTTQNIFNRLGKLLAGVLKFIGKAFGILFILIGGATIIGLFFGGFYVGSIEALGVSREFGDFPEFMFDSSIPFWALSLSGFILFTIPFLLLLILGIRILSGKNPMGKTTSLTLLGLWLISMLTLIFASIEHETNYQYSEYTTVRQPLNIPGDSISIAMNEGSYFSLEGFQEFSEGYQLEEILYDKQGNGVLYSNHINVDIKPSKEKSGFIKIKKRAYGRNSLKTKERTKEIKFDYEIRDNQLLLNNFFTSKSENISKKMDLSVTIYLPESSILYLDDSTEIFLDDVKNEQDIYDGNMPNHYYRVTKKSLTCLDCD